MAHSDFLKAMIRAHLDGEGGTFRQLALQVAAKEASAGHSRLAQEIRDLVDNAALTSGQQAGRVPPAIKTSIPRANVAELLHAFYPREHMTDMVLSSHTRESLERAISECRNRGVLEAHGLQPRSKLLLVGPAGCGKTMSARVLASELGCPLFEVKLEGLISRFLGETSVHLKSIFDAMNHSTGVYLFDEFDSIGTARGDHTDVGEIRRVLSTFLILLESHRGPSLVLAATNYDKSLDAALFRRFDDVIDFPMPDRANIRLLLDLRLSHHEHEPMNLNAVAREAVGMSYAEVTKAILEAVKGTVLADNRVLPLDTLRKSIRSRKAMVPAKP